MQEGQTGHRGGDVSARATFEGNLNTGHSLELFLVTFALFSEENGDVIQLLKFILTPGTFPTIARAKY